MTLTPAEKKKLEALAWRYVEAKRKQDADDERDGTMLGMFHPNVIHTIAAFLDRLAARKQLGRGKK